MGIPVLILGKSGSGKSTSLRNFNSDEVGILNVASKPLPFRNGNKFKIINNADYVKIAKALKKHILNTYVIDDSQYLMAFDSFANAGVKGYEKFTNMAVNFYELLQYIIRETPPDVIVYLLHHTEESDTGDIKAKTIGKMLDQQLTIEGLFSIVLMAIIGEDGNHYFLTRSNGHNPVKTPMDMFGDERIDNDLKMVDTAIREYYGLNNKEEETENE
ncbi:MAG: ATP-binding protein [Clostridia bacterium]|nr:ATP-binding protein [Clostridia bacterium]